MVSRRLVNSLLVLTVMGCSVATTPSDPIVDKLTNRGVIIVTPDNPYLAANQFLSKQTSASSELTGFLKLKGYPSAFELSQTTFGPLILTFYYPSARERYELEKTTTTWIISGPFPLSTSEMDRLPTSSNAQTLRSATVTPTPNVKTPKQKTPTLAKPTPTPTPETTPIIPTTGFSSPEPIPTKIEVTSALEKNGSSEDLAEMSPRGDLVHYVTISGETLSIIARWYTDDRENAGKIGRLNRLKNSDELAIGDTIIIPSYMIKNKKRLSESDLKRLSELAEQQKRLKK